MGSIYFDGGCGVGRNQGLRSTCAAPGTAGPVCTQSAQFRENTIGVPEGLSLLAEVKKIVETFKLSSQGQFPLRIHLQKAGHTLFKPAPLGSIEHSKSQMLNQDSLVFNLSISPCRSYIQRCACYSYNQLNNSLSGKSTGLGRSRKEAP